MHVAVDEARQHHAAAGVHFLGAAREGEILQAPAGPHFDDQAVGDQYRAILNDAQVPEIGPAPGTARAAQSEQLPRAPDQGDFPHSRKPHTQTTPAGEKPSRFPTTPHASVLA